VAFILNQVVEQLDAVFHALADPTRRSMVRGLAEREQTVGELAQPYAISLAAASKHIKVLERAGLVRRTVHGRRHVCRLEPAPVAAASHHLRFYEQFWIDRLDALEALVSPIRRNLDDPRPARHHRLPHHRGASGRDLRALDRARPDAALVRHGR
jgi:DNA-binding transcriptional ArsR family regulator